MTDAAAGADGARVELYRRLPLLPTDRWWVDLARAGPDGRVLELGAGAGRLTMALAEAGLEVTAVERDAGMLEVLSARAPAGVEVVAADAADLPPLGRYGTVILATSLLNEVPDAATRHRVLAGAAAACRPDGRVAVHLLGPWWLARLPPRSVGRLTPADGSAAVEVAIADAGLDAWAGRRRAQLTYRFADGRRFEDRLDAAIVAGSELEAAFDVAGLEVEARFGPAPPDDGPSVDDLAWHVVGRPRARP